MPATDIIAWGASYRGGDDGLASAFAELAGEGLFLRVQYPVFAVPVFYCSYEERFLAELPAGFSFPHHDASALVAFWKRTRAENNKQFGQAWTYWGMCFGQGSQSGSSPDGVCLGPGCSWFIDGAKECQWSLCFADLQRTGWPDTSILRDLEDKPSEAAIEQLLESFRKN